jgi:hypothetical protein
MATETVIFARQIPAVAETLGGAGVLFDGLDLDGVGKIVRELLADEEAKAAVLAGQAERLKAFLPRRFLARLAGLVEMWLESVE